MNTHKLAFFGSPPEFDKVLPVGQLYFPSWERYVASFRGIFERQYYTNQGPLTNELEQKLEQFLGVRHVVCVTNATIGLMMAAESMGLSGKVILPAYTFIASAQSLTWAGLEPVFCDIDPLTHQMALDQIDALITDDVSAIMGVNLWGGSCNPSALSELAHARGVQLYFDSAHAFGCKVGGVSIGNFGKMEVFSFHATKILSAAEGGCICTNDDALAVRLRNIRSGYGIEQAVEVDRTSNGRMSEAQAAVALMSLEDFPANRENNERLYRIYEQRLAGIPGLHLVRPTGVSVSNYQYVVCMVDEAEFGLPRDALLAVLNAENINARRYFYPGVHRCVPYVHGQAYYPDRLPNTDRACASCIQFPIGALVSDGAAGRICDVLSRIHHAAPNIRVALKPGSAGG
ncbi:MAG: DegT/DnrJ/EryC1/StrS family aminotransferase [Gammaproteobacteria bacterium]|nr:DegT/DnrJ/EryC1/StrS family aminotransferase [Gammaproteobacteria bacterium]